MPLSRDSSYCEKIKCKYYEDYLSAGGKKSCGLWQTPVENILDLDSKKRICVPRWMMTQPVRDGGTSQWGRKPDTKILSDGGTLQSLQPDIIKTSSRKPMIQQFIERQELDKFGSFTNPNEFKGQFLKDEFFEIRENSDHIVVKAHNLNKGRIEKIYKIGSNVLNSMSTEWNEFWRV